jgi:hypothetical protein
VEVVLLRNVTISRWCCWTSIAPTVLPVGDDADSSLEICASQRYAMMSHFGALNVAECHPDAASSSASLSPSPDDDDASVVSRNGLAAPHAAASHRSTSFDAGGCGAAELPSKRVLFCVEKNDCADSWYRMHWSRRLTTAVYATDGLSNKFCSS